MIGWYSQKFPPGGASAAEGIRKQLGQPKLNPLTVLVREAAQNSWDARTGNESVRFSVSLADLPAGVAPVWRRLLLGQGAPSKAHLPLRTTLDRKRFRVLTISDRGTRGLGGPTRADNAIVDDNDFVSFVRNVGEPRNTNFGGGTYGFGKSIFYRLSRCGSVLIHTRCHGVDGIETRLIGCSLWESYTVGQGMGGQRYTGRHWWGDTSGEIIEPLVGEAAESVARQLRLDEFAPDETGTSITIIDPELDMDPDDADSDAECAADWIANSMAWNLWPKMLHRDAAARPDMLFSVSLNGRNVEVPDPTTTQPLSHFVAAFRGLDTPCAAKVASLRPKRHLGMLSMRRSFTPAFDANGVAEENGFDGTSHHICLLRSPELVVKYLAGPTPGSRMLGYSGVFRADDDVDDVFAKAEPPTHDDWVATHLDGAKRTFVNVAMRRLKDAANKQISPPQPGTAPQVPGIALGPASMMLADLVCGIGTRPKERASDSRGQSGTSDNDSTGDRSDRESDEAARSTSRSHRRNRKPVVSYRGDLSFMFSDGEPVLCQEFSIDHHTAVTVRANLDIAISGGRERRSDAPTGSAVPQVRGWCRSDGSDFTGQPVLLHPGDGSVWTLLIRPVPDTSTEVALSATEHDNV